MYLTDFLCKIFFFFFFLKRARCSFLRTHLFFAYSYFSSFSFFFLCTCLPLPSFTCIILFQPFYLSHYFYVCPFSSTFILFLFKFLQYSLCLPPFRCCFATNFTSSFPGIRHLLCRIKKTCACTHRLCCS